jgi:hypothetical protein
MNTIETGSEPFLSKRRLGWAGLAALLGGCAVCFSVPLFTALGGGSVAAAIARYARPGTELAVGGIVFTSALGIAACRRWMSRSALSSGCGGGACSVTPRSSAIAGTKADHAAESRDDTAIFSHQGSENAPMVCSGDLALAQIQIDGYRAAFAHLVHAERFPGGFRWKFRSELGLESQLMGLAEREGSCCPFFTFHVTREGGHLVWETRAPERAGAILDEYFRLPETLRDEPRPGHDVIALKRAADRAGLAFSADRGAPAKS